MLILCSGPDTFRAIKKARELEGVFKQKYDPQGLCVERLSAGKELVSEIAARAGAISLFAPRRFVRVSNLLTDASKTQRATLKRVLKNSQDEFIVLSVEEELPTAVVLKEVESEVKVVRYDFPLLQGQAFFTWAKDEGAMMGLSSEQTEAIARATEGDTWGCFFELMKYAANPGAELANQQSGEGTVFAYADAYIASKSTWWGVGERADLVKQISTTFLSQVRAGVRVRDGATEGLYPFIARKLRGAKLDNIDERCTRVLESYFLQRSGYGDESEVLGVL